MKRTSSKVHSTHQGLRLQTAISFAAVLTMLILVLTGCDVDVNTGGDTPDLEQGPERSVALRIEEGPQGQVLAFIPMFINDQGPYNFALDTGASMSVIDQDLANELGLETTGPTGPVTGITGEAQAQVVRVEQWRMGEDLSLPASDVAMTGLPDPDRDFGIQGLLGSDLLSAFGSITIDYDAGLLVVRPQEESPSPTPEQ